MTRIADGIDHLIIGVDDLEEGRAVYGRLGFTMTPRGRHPGWGTGNYCMMFRDDYLELMGVVDRDEFDGHSKGLFKHREGLMGLVFHTSDSLMTAKGLEERGVSYEGPKDLSRPLELPEGEVHPAFKLTFPDADAMPGLNAFICEHLTPEMIRRPDWLDHPNGATGIMSMTVLVESPVALEDPYLRLFGSGQIIETDNTLVVRAGRGMVVFCHPDDIGMLHPEARHLSADTLPAPVAMTLAVSNIETTVAHLEKAGVEHRQLADGTVAVPPSEALGVLVEFREQP